jgi:hypothetical protein
MAAFGTLLSRSEQSPFLAPKKRYSRNTRYITKPLSFLSSFKSGYSRSNDLKYIGVYQSKGADSGGREDGEEMAVVRHHELQRVLSFFLFSFFLFFFFFSFFFFFFHSFKSGYSRSNDLKYRGVYQSKSADSGGREDGEEIVVVRHHDPHDELQRLLLVRDCCHLQF